MTFTIFFYFLPQYPLCPPNSILFVHKFKIFFDPLSFLCGRHIWSPPEWAGVGKKRDILIRRRHPMMIAILRGARENLPGSEISPLVKQGVLVI